MKIKTFMTIIFVSVFVSFALPSCSDDAELNDGYWPLMQWKTDVKMNKDHTINVAAEGGTYIFICKNYNPWISNLTESDTLIYGIDINHIKGEWLVADSEDEKLTVIIMPNTTGEQRKAVLRVNAGDVFDCFSFIQKF